MKVSSVSWTIKQFKTMVEKGTISFDYPIQRSGDQWDQMQKSLLIHSICDGYPIPPLYALIVDKVYYILDGKQRLTNIIDYINNIYETHEDTPSCHIFDEGFSIDERLFSEQREEVQDEILSFSLTVRKIDEANDEEIEEMFYRLNNGTPLTKQHKAKAKMGKEWASKMTEITKHPTMELAAFTGNQKKRSDDETAVLQTMMYLDGDCENKGFSNNDAFLYTQTFKEDGEGAGKGYDKVIEGLDYIGEAISTKETLLLRKVHFPMTVLTALHAKNNDVSPEQFAEWKEVFKAALKDEDDTTTDYKDFGGAGSVKRDKFEGRVNSMITHFNKYFNIAK